MHVTEQKINVIFSILSALLYSLGVLLGKRVSLCFALANAVRTARAKLDFSVFSFSRFIFNAIHHQRHLHHHHQRHHRRRRRYFISISSSLPLFIYKLYTYMCVRNNRIFNEWIELYNVC